MRQKLIILPKLNRAGKQWFIYYSCRCPKTGKMVRFRLYDGFTGLSVEKKLHHAQELIDKYSTRLRTGWTPFSDDSEIIYNDHVDYKTVADLYGSRRASNKNIRFYTSKYLEYIKQGVSPSTLITYRSKLRIMVLWLEREKLADNDLTCFDNQLIGLFFHYLIDERKLSKVSIRKYTELLTNVFEFFKKEKAILINPVFDIPVCNRINDQAPRPIQKADIKLFKKEIWKDLQLRLAVQFEFYCSLRPGHEIREMKVKDLDFIAGTVRVTRTRAKSSVERIVTIPVQLLKELRSTYNNFKGYDRESYIFTRRGVPGSVPVSKNYLARKFNVIRKKLNMPWEYKFYSWKHTGLISADEEKIPFKAISQHAGHTSTRTTEIYFRNKKPAVSKAIRDHWADL